MTDKASVPAQKPGDDILTAFIDGELSAEDSAAISRLIEDDAAVAERVEFLSRASLDFAGAFRPLLDAAPRAALQARLDMAGLPPPPAPAGSESGFAIGRRGFAGLLAASLVAGVFADRAWLTLAGAGKDDDGDDSSAWRAVVAQYMSLYTAGTLGNGVVSREAQRAQLAAINEQIGLSLRPDAIVLPQLHFRRAQILAYDDRPLAQIMYLDEQNEPMALCIMREGGAIMPVTTERRHAMNIAWWASGDHQAMLIGHRTAGETAAMAGALARQISV